MNVRGDTFEVLTIPYEQVFPRGYQQNPPKYQTSRPRYHQNYHHYPQTQPNNGNWVCRNSVGDTLIINTDNMKIKINQGTWNQPYVPPRQPYQPNQPNYPKEPQTTNPTTKQNPFLPNTPTTPAPINCNNYPQHPMCGEVIILGSTTTAAPETRPNTSGEGILDIK